MGPSPPQPSSSCCAPLSSPPCSSSSSSLADWLFMALSDRDTQIVTQALTHELSSPREAGLGGSDPSLRVLGQGSCDLQQSRAGAAAAMAGSAAAAAAMAAGSGSDNGFSQAGSPPSYSSLSASNSGSPYRSVSAINAANHSACRPPDGLLAPMESDLLLLLQAEGLVPNSFNSLHHLYQTSGSSQRSRGAAMALSAPAACGGVGKRRSRAAHRSPITFHWTDISNFRAMVQQLTGIPSTSSSSSSFSSSSAQLYAEAPSLLQAAKNPHAGTVTLPTLDTSAALLRCRAPAQDPLQGFSFTRNNQNHLSSYLPSVGGDGVPLHYCKESMVGDRSRPSSDAWRTFSLSAIINKASHDSLG